MAIDPVNNANSLLLGLLPHSEVEPFLLKEDADEWPTYTFLRVPSTMEELLPYITNKGLFIRMGNGTLAYVGKGNRFPPATTFKKFFEMTSSAFVYILGDSEDALVETAAFFGTLKSPAKEIEIRYKNHVSFDDARAEQMALILDKNQTKKISFFDSTMDSALSAMIASRPYPMHIDALVAPIDIDAFIEHLQGRTSSFGTLSLERALDTSGLRRLFHHLDLFENLHVDELPSDLILQLLSTPMKSIGFHVGRESDETDFSTAEIIPKDIRIKSVHDDFPSRFMLSFLHRVAHLGHLESLTLSLYGHHPAPVDVGKALIDAIGASKQLKTLELIVSELVTDYIKEIFGVLERHEGLRTLRLCRYPKRLDPDFSWLKQLLKRNRRIQVTDLHGSKEKIDDEMDEIYAMNRFFRGSERLTKVATVIRSLLMGAAFTHSAADDFQRAGLLLKDHVDMFCEILHEMECSGRADAENSIARRDTEDDLVLPAQPQPKAGQKRRRSNLE